MSEYDTLLTLPKSYTDDNSNNTTITSKPASSSTCKALFIFIGLVGVIIFGIELFGSHSNVNNHSSSKQTKQNNIQRKSSTNSISSTMHNAAIIAPNPDDNGNGNGFGFGNGNDNDNGNGNGNGNGGRRGNGGSSGSTAPGTIEPTDPDEGCLSTCNELCFDNSNCNDWCATFGQFCYVAGNEGDAECGAIEDCQG